MLDVTIIGAKTKFEGSANINKDIVIEGSYKGSINSTANVVVGEKGYLNGTVACKDLSILGKAEGTIICGNQFQLAPRASFSGEVQAKVSDITPGAVFDGKLKIVR